MVRRQNSDLTDTWFPTAGRAAKRLAAEKATIRGDDSISARAALQHVSVRRTKEKAEPLRDRVCVYGALPSASYFSLSPSLPSTLLFMSFDRSSCPAATSRHGSCRQPRETRTCIFTLRTRCERSPFKPRETEHPHFSRFERSRSFTPTLFPMISNPRDTLSTIDPHENTRRFGAPSVLRRV